jgi:tRNA pseudouridine32 synthase/23S rRNA pseudouridine746 synthase
MNLILYADPTILVINKPAGLRTIPDGYHPELPTVQSVLTSTWGRLFIVHRLDKDTSGVLLLARDADTHRALDRQFAERQVHKTYRGLCLGVPNWQRTEIDLPLRVNGDRSHRTVVDSVHGKDAHTLVRLLQVFDGFSLIEAAPSTGYTHQIRAHLSALGFPLLGDPLYHLPPQRRGQPFDAQRFLSFPRTALHAAALTFVHPREDAEMTFRAPDPADFDQYLALHR